MYYCGKCRKTYTFRWQAPQKIAKCPACCNRMLQKVKKKDIEEKK